MKTASVIDKKTNKCSIREQVLLGTGAELWAVTVSTNQGTEASVLCPGLGLTMAKLALNCKANPHTEFLTSLSRAWSLCFKDKGAVAKTVF